MSNFRIPWRSRDERPGPGAAVPVNRIEDVRDAAFGGLRAPAPQQSQRNHGYVWILGLGAIVAGVFGALGALAWLSTGDGIVVLDETCEVVDGELIHRIVFDGPTVGHSADHKTRVEATATVAGVPRTQSVRLYQVQSAEVVNRRFVTPNGDPGSCMHRIVND